MSDAGKPAAKPVKKLPATAFAESGRGADYARAYHHIRVDPDTTFEDLLRPNFWAYHVARLNPGDLVDVVAKDFSMDVQLRVIGKEIGLVHMKPLRALVSDRPTAITLPSDDIDLPELPENYKVQFAPKSGWVTRTIDPPETVATSKTKLAAHQAALVHSRKAMGLAA